MGKHILIISGSPRRKGNSDLLCDQFMLGAQEAGHQVEKIFLRDKKVGYCVACDACRSNGGICTQQDDMADILAGMIAADVIVLATPIYFYTIDGQMKTLIDRTYARYTEISGKEFYFIMTAADNRPQAIDRALAEFRGFTSCLSGAQEKGFVFGAGAWQKGDIKGNRAMDEALRLGRGL